MDENAMDPIHRPPPTDTPSSDTIRSPLGGAAEQLLSNPDLLARIGSIINTVSAAPHSAAPSSSVDTPQTASVGGGMPIDGLSAILSNPAMLEKLPQIMAMLKPMMAAAPAAPTAAPPREKSMADCRDDLLCALKPFLSPERREAVDSLIRIAKLGIVLKQLK